MIKKLELTAKEKFFLDTMVNGNGLKSIYREKYGCDPCDACGPSACEDCKGCIEGTCFNLVNPFKQYNR